MKDITIYRFDLASRFYLVVRLFKKLLDKVGICAYTINNDSSLGAVMGLMDISYFLIYTALLYLIEEVFLL